MKKYFIILFFFYLILSCTSNTSSSKTSWNRVQLNDSLDISFPSYYNKNGGRWTGKDTWGFQKSREDGKINFSFEAGPGTPYQPLVVDTLTHIHYVYPYGVNVISPAREKYYNLKRLTARNNLKLAFYSRPYVKGEKNGVVLIQRDTSYIEFLFVEFPDSEIDEVVKILETIERR